LNIQLTVKGEVADLGTDSHNIVNRWKKYYCLLYDVHRVNDVKQTKMHTARDTND